MEFHEFKMNYLKNNLMSVAEEEMNVRIEKMKFLGGGSYGRVFKAQTADGDVFALKAYRRKGMNEDEKLQLQTLSANTDVPMPQILHSHSDENISFLAMSFIEGKNVLDPVFMLNSKSKKADFAEKVVKGMLQWHSVEGEKYGELKNPIYENWYEYYRNEIVEDVLSFLNEKVQEGRFSNDELELYKKATELYDKIGDEPEKPVLIHGDLNIMNIMAKPKKFELTGFIDPCDSMWANREYDLFQLRNMWGDKYYLYETYKKHCKLSKDSDFKIVYYGVINEVKCFRNSGEDFALWREIWNNRLKKEMAKY